jgi:chaperonin GroES
VLVKTLPANSKTQSGIIIPDSAKEKPQEAEVIAVGAGTLMENGNLRPIDLKEGDKVLFSKYSGVSVKSENEDILLLREGDILAVIVEK